MERMSYAEQLRHPNWQRKRLEVLGHADFACQRCGDAESTLHVHHKRYVKGRMAWEYEAHELQALCEACHAKLHEFREVMDLLLLQGRERLSKAVGLLGGYEAANMNIDGHEEDASFVTGPYYFMAAAVGAMLLYVGAQRAADAVEAARAATVLNPAERELLDRLRRLDLKALE